MYLSHYMKAQKQTKPFPDSNETKKPKTNSLIQS